MKAVVGIIVPLLLLSLLPSVVRAETCLTGGCHAAIGRLTLLHQPVADGDCSSCHQQRRKEHPLKGEKSFALTMQGAELCNQCHDSMGKKKVVHSPVAEGDCLSCHQPHGSANRYLLPVGDNLSELCFGCHDGEPFRRQFMHGPSAVGACTQCHSPHEADRKALLKQSIRDTCLNCHKDFAGHLQAASVIHPPVAKGACTDCHDPHASSADFVLKKKMPDLCLGCHTKIGQKLAKAKVRHQPVEQEGSCGSCHSTHFSKSRGLLGGEEIAVCLRCHGEDNLGKPPLANIKKQLADKKYVHGPLQQGKCSPCHDPHGSDNFRLLTGPYPEDLYLPFQEGAYDFCLQCHDKNMLRFEDTTLYTRFRNGNRNLHFVHVANKRKGRTCRICHEPHATDGQKLISKAGMPFGDWKIPIDFEMTPTGGSCAPGCHRPLKYDRKNPENYHPGNNP